MLGRKNISEASVELMLWPLEWNSRQLEQILRKENLQDLVIDEVMRKRGGGGIPRSSTETMGKVAVF